MLRLVLRLESLEDRMAPAVVGLKAEQQQESVRLAAQLIAAPVPPLPTVTIMPGGTATLPPNFELVAAAYAAPPEVDAPPDVPPDDGPADDLPIDCYC